MMGNRRPLSPGFRGCCRTAHEGGGLPEGEGIPAGITHDLVLLMDVPARRMEREERLLAMRGGHVNYTLYEICIEGGGKDARFLLAHGADANYTAAGVSVLWLAASKGQLAGVEVLLDAGVGNHGQALEYGASNGHTNVVALLLDRGADVHCRDDQALFNAACNGHQETVALLLQRGATARDHILNVAVERGHHAIADLLRAHRAV
jgi:hypothetical protein